MLLGFKQNFPWGEPTHFREKILTGVGKKITVEATSYFNTKTFESTPTELKELKPKIHTFRSDPHNRWKPGMSIQMVYRGKNYSILDHFNKDVPELEKCRSTQKVKIKWSNPVKGDPLEDIAKIMKIKTRYLSISVDGKEIAEFKFSDSYCGSTDLKNIVQNDGFNNVFDFAKWFNKDWEGKIIHWSDFRY